MSEQDDKAVFEMATQQYHPDQLQDQIERVRKAVSYGRATAAPDREMLGRFLQFNAEHPGIGAEAVINEFLKSDQQLESKEGEG